MTLLTFEWAVAPGTIRYAAVELSSSQPPIQQILAIYGIMTLSLVPARFQSWNGYHSHIPIYNFIR